MAYSELIKNFNRIRDYMREFYVYGFKSRDEYSRKSARSYDDEKRRLESWLGDYMQFRQTPEGKTVFLSIDSRVSRHNPLYAAWKTKSFTDGDMTLHFILFDILHSPGTALTLKEITGLVDEYLSSFDEPRMFDSSTVRKKLNEYVSEGIVVSEKRGKTMYYRRAEDADLPDPDVLDFFSEAAPCGVIGSFLLDKADAHRDHFAFKHHYITGAMDSEIVCQLFAAMSEKRSITIESINRHKDRLSENRVVPLRLMISAQSGRQYLMAYVPRLNRIISFRTDNIASVRPGEVSERFDELREKLDGMIPNMWGVSTQSRSGGRMEHVEFTVRYSESEAHIHQRLEREKRCGTVERIDDHTSRFSADVFDSSELVPWIRTFICRIIDFSFSNKALEAQFREDIEEMYRLYGLGEVTEDDLQ
ncbi:MAG: WYL domain-containing transcriptional regulator [Firmicutes bacterium]|nr:WYL domain-containing transcriptional regulator [Bacillota bacterium]